MNSTTRLVLIGAALVAAIIILWPNYTFNQLDSERKAQDSLGLIRWDSLHKEEYLEARNSRVKLGLDLQGGIYITMEVDVPGMLQESAQRDAVDDIFQQVITATRKDALLSNDPVIDIFTKEFDKIARPKGKTLLNYYDVGNLGSDGDEDAIISKLSQNIDDAVDQAVEVVRQRIDKYGVSEPTIQKVGGRRIVIELPGVSDESEVRSLLQTTARLEFKLVKNNADGAKLFKRFDEILAGKISTDTVSTTVDSTSNKSDPTVAKSDTTKADSGTIAKHDTSSTDSTKPTANADSGTTKPGDTADPYAGLSDEEKVKAYRKDHPFTVNFLTRMLAEGSEQYQEASGIYAGSQFPAGEYDFLVPKKHIATIKKLLQRKDIEAIFPDDLIISFSAHSDFPDPSNAEESLYGMYLLTRDPELTGEVVTDARPGFDQTNNKPMVTMQMDADGAERWANITGRNIKKRVAIVLDSAVYSAPVVQAKISGGNSQITGSKDAKEANLLAVVLKAGALKAPVKIIEERVVGPSLGEDSIRQGLNATMLAALLVVLFMVTYYAVGGAIADVAVMLNIVLTMAVLAAFNATLTLPGIGGLVLTIGMAVDANILIYERIREELAAGKSLKNAVNLGYDKAFSAIIDSNITTFLTGTILYFFGTGPIQGFAVTLMIGILATMFTAVFVTRAVFSFMLDRGTTSINFGQPKAARQSA